jgi:signal transduction histidine kinase
VRSLPGTTVPGLGTPYSGGCQALAKTAYASWWDPFPLVKNLPPNRPRASGNDTTEDGVIPYPSARAVHVEALDVMSDLLMGVGEGSPPDAFFSSLCEAICRLTSMRRAVLFRYDSARRRVRAVGAHGIELEEFADLFVTVDSVPIARQALAEDRVLEVLGADDFDVPASLRKLLRDVLIVCTPMAAAGRYVGVVLSEREASLPTMGDGDRHLLWTLGKAIAMASVAREVTAYGEQSRQLQQRIDLAREIHEGVVQRLFGVSLALSREDLLDAESQRRCALEVRTALGDLHAALERPLGHTSRPTAVTFAEELERVRGLHADLDIVLVDGTPEQVPSNLEALAQSILVEAVRNASKHARSSHVGVSLRSDGSTFVLEVRNDGADLHNGGHGGVGLRLATLEALQHGGVLEYGESEPGAWQVRLVVPTGQ